MVACISQAAGQLEETMNTIKYAQKARAIQNTAMRMEIVSILEEERRKHELLLAEK
jgi:hypothetical protein